MKDYGTFRRHILAVPFELIMAAGAIVTVLRHDWAHVATSLFTLAVSFAPLIIERLLRVRIPPFLQMIYVAFVFASMFSGEVLGMYGRIWVWDDIMHVISGLLVGAGSVLCLVDLERHQRIRIPVWLKLVFVFCMGASVAVLWEIVEFTSDSLFGTFLQRGSLSDTMFDLIEGVIGTLCMVGLFWLHLQGRRVLGLSVVIQRYIRLNRS